MANRHVIAKYTGMRFERQGEVWDVAGPYRSGLPNHYEVISEQTGKRVGMARSYLRAVAALGIPRPKQTQHAVLCNHAVLALPWAGVAKRLGLA